MKIIVLHGDDTARSFERLKKFIETARGRSWEVSYIDESTVSFPEAVSNPSLFGAERFFVLSSVKTVGKKDLAWLRKNYQNLSGNLIIYSESFLSRAFLNLLPKDSKVEEFKLPKLIWTFLEALIPGNTESLKNLHRILEKNAPEFVFSLIAKLFRDLYWVSIDTKTINYPGWRISRLSSQAKKFGKERLLEIIDELSKIDIGVKKGQADLVSSLDLLILTKLK